jgi:hypothetical protein
MAWCGGAHTVIPAIQEAEAGGLWFRVSPGKVSTETLAEKQTRSKMTGDVAQVHLLSKWEALSSNSPAPKNSHYHCHFTKAV